MSETADRFRRAAEGLTATIAAVPADRWDDPSPCAGWVGRDVVRHLVEWVPGPGFLLGAFGVETCPIPSVDHDPAVAWAAVRDAVQAALDDPVTAATEADCGPPGRMTLEAAVAMTLLPDVLVHTWDLAQAAGVTAHLDADEVSAQAAQAAQIPPHVDEAIRSSGHFGPRVPVADGADDLTRLLAFYGRRA